jgi:hypothetical protein
MAEIIDRMELSKDQCVELDEHGITWLVQALEPGEPAVTMRLDAAAATMLFDFLLIYQERLCRWAQGFTP